VPIVVATARAVADGWVPVGDAALIAIRAQDVLGGQVPRLGMWASTSWTVGFDLNHPGPLLYDAMAVPVALFGNAAGSTVAVGLIEAVSVVAIVAVAQRRGGPLVGAWAAAVAAALCWSFGSAVLVEPWHATTVLLPFMLLAVLAWAVADGDLWCLPAAVLVGSLVVQTNLSYGIFGPVLLGWAVVAHVLGRRRPRSERSDAHELPDEPAGEGSHRRDVRAVPWAVVATAVVGVLAWAQPLAEQFTGAGEGNISRVVRSLGEDTMTLEWGRALQTVADVVALPPWWLRPSYHSSLPFGPFGNPVPSLLVAIAALATVAGLLAWALAVTRRRGDHTAAALVGTAIALAIAALVTANQSPTAPAGTVTYQLRWLWPVAAFVTFALGTVALRALGPGPVRLGGRSVGRRTAALAGLAALTGTAALANLPTSDQGTTSAAGTVPVAREIVDQLDAVDVPEPLLVNCAEGVFDPYCEAAMAGLVDRGVELRIHDDLGERQLGSHRRWDGTDAAATLTVRAGELAGFGGPGEEQLAFHEPLDDAETAELARLRADLAEALDDGDLRLGERGRRLARRGGLESVDDGGRVDGAAAVELRRGLFGDERRDLGVMVHHDLLDADDAWSARLDRWDELQGRVDNQTVGVYLSTPASAPDPLPEPDP
jgi:hypothetical protein